MDEEGLSRKEKLALWRAKKGGGAGAKHSKVDKSVATGKGSQNLGGVLAARADAGNVAKKPASRPAKRNTQRKPFQVSHGHERLHAQFQGPRETLFAPPVQALLGGLCSLSFVARSTILAYHLASNEEYCCFSCCSCSSGVQANCPQYESPCSRWKT